jgi:hypothetical protein
MLWTFFGKCSVRISLGASPILTQILHGFPRALRANAMVVFRLGHWAASFVETGKEIGHSSECQAWYEIDKCRLGYR